MSQNCEMQGCQWYVWNQNALKSIFAKKGNGLWHLFITSNSTHFFNKTDFEQYLFKKKTHWTDSSFSTNYSWLVSLLPVSQTNLSATSQKLINYRCHLYASLYLHFYLPGNSRDLGTFRSLSKVETCLSVYNTQ